MNRNLLLLVSYFVCLLFFTTQAKAATFIVNNPAADNSAGTLANIVSQVNAAGAGPHTISITSNTTYWGSSVTLTANDVTITGNVAGCGTPTHVVDWAAASIIIAGNNCVITGLIFRSASLVLQGSNNRVWGCWFNMNAAGTAAQGGAINNGTAIFVDGGTGNTIGLGTQCRNVFSGSNMNHMIRVAGAANNTIISSNYMGVAANGTTQIGTSLGTQTAVFFENGIQTGCRVDSNTIATTGTAILISAGPTGLNIRANDISNVLLNGIKVESVNTLNNLSILNNKIRQVVSAGDPTAEDDGFGIKLRNFTSNTVLIQGNLIGVQADGHVNTLTDMGCQKNGIYARANIAAFTINNNVVCDNGNLSGDREMYSGMFIKAEGETFGTITVTNNYIGVDKFGGAKGNDFAGINVRYVSGGMTSVTVTGNVVGDNGFNGGSTKKSHGIAFEGFKPASTANFIVNSNYVGVYPTSYANIGNYGNGIELNNCSNFQIGAANAGNVVGFNKMATTFSDFDGGGIVVTGSANANGLIQGNLIGETADGLHLFGNTNADPHIVPIANHFSAGISILNSSNITIGGTAANLANIVRNNNYGIAIAGASSTGNTLYRNTVAANTNFGVYISGSANTVGDAAAFTNANIITGNGRDGVHVYGTSAINNRITRNQISCNTGQGIKLNYGANQGNSGQAPPVITNISGNTVSGTATAGATIEIFIDDPSCQIACGSSTSDNRREGKTYLTTVTATGGNWTYTHGSAIDQNNVSATATVGSNTSEFSTCNLIVLCPADANAGPNQNLCNVTTTTLAGNTVTNGGTGIWTVESGTGTVTTPSSPTSGVTGLVAGTPLVLKWTISKTGCPSTEATVTITVSAPSQSNAGTTQNLCNVTTTNLNATTTVGTGVWTANQAGRTVTTPSSPTSGVTGLQVGANTFTWTVTNGACAAATSTVTVNVSAPSQSNAGTAQALCNVTTANLNATTTVGTGAWTTSSGATITTPSSPTSGVTGLSVGANTFTWTVTNGACTAATSTVTITVSAPSQSNAGTAQALCNVTTANLNATTTVGTGAWTTSSGATITTPSSPTSGVTGLSVGANTFTWTVTNGACTAATSTVTITVSAPSQSNAGTTQNLCNVTTTNLNATTTVGTGVWTANQAGRTVTTPSSPTSGVTGLQVGANTFTWTVTNGACAAATSTVTVNVSAPSQSNAGTAQALCNVTTANLNATTTVGTGAWTTSSGATITTPSSPTSGVTGLSVGANTFTWTVTNGACTAATSTVTITVSAPSQSNAGTAQALCNVTTANLNATTTVGTGAWTTSSGATITTPSSPTSGVTGLSVGANTFTWTVTNGSCTAATSTVTITVSAPSQSNAGTAQTLCNVTTANLNATTTVGTGAWTTSSGATITNPSSPTSSVTGLTVGNTHTFTWTVTNGACAAATSTVTITINAPSQSNAGSSQTLCNATTATLNANTTISAGVWSGPGGVTISNPNSPNTGVSGLAVGANVFTWTVTNGVCSAVTSNVTITVEAPSQANAGSDQSLCNVTTASLNAGTSVGTGVWTTSSGATITNPNSPTSGVTGLQIGANTFTWTVTNGTCAAATATTTITVSAPGTTSAGPDQALCNVTTTNLSGSGTTGTWTTVSGSGVVTNSSSPSSGVTGLTVGSTTVFRWTVTSGACSGSAEVNVTVSAPPVGTAGSDLNLCNATTATLSATGGGIWSNTSGSGVVTTPSDPASGVTNLTPGATSVFTWTVVNGACTSTSTLTVNSSLPATSDGGQDQTLCNATTTSLTASGTGTWSTFSGTGVATSLNSPISGVTGLTPGQTTVFEWRVTNGNCTASSFVNIVSSSPVTADAGPNQSLCNVTVTNLAGVGTGTWTVATSNTGTGVLTTPSSATSGVTNLTIGGAPSVFTWTVVNGACSNSANVSVSVSPGTTADAGSNQTLCNETTTTLDAMAGTNGTWLASTDATIDNLADPNSLVTVINSPATLTWQIDGGGCGTASAQVTITAVTLDKPILDGTGLSQACSGSTYTYSIDNIDAAGTYAWSSNPASGITITPPSGTSVDVSATSSGKLIVFVNKGGCSDSASAVITVLPGNPADADTVRLATCLLTNYVIETPIIDGFPLGTWTSDGGSLTFTYNPADSTTTIGPITDNWSDTLVYTVTNACGSTRYPFILKIGGVFQSLEASGPSDTLCVSQARNLNAFVDPAGDYTYYWVSNVNYNNPVIDANVRIDSTTVPTYSVTPTGPNNVYFVYVVDKASQCKTDIDTAYIHAVEGQDLNVPNLITPNEDNMNDYWVLRDKVTGKDILPGSQFDLYNRWGQRVFTMSDYDNRFNANHISDGIYYFNVKSGCGDKEYKGWLQILGNTNP